MKLLIEGGYTLTGDGSQWILERPGKGIAVVREHWDARPPADGTAVTRQSDGPNGEPRTVYRHRSTARVDRLYYGSLQDAAHGLLSRGILTEPQTQKGWAASEAIRIASSWFEDRLTHVMAGRNAPSTTVTFGRGRFLATTNPSGGWSLRNPPRDVKTLGDGSDVVGHCGTLFQAFHLATHRSFHADPRMLPYADANAALRQTAEQVMWGLALRAPEPDTSTTPPEGGRSDDCGEDDPEAFPDPRTLETAPDSTAGKPKRKRRRKVGRPRKPGPKPAGSRRAPKHAK